MISSTVRIITDEPHDGISYLVAFGKRLTRAEAIALNTPNVLTGTGYSYTIESKGPDEQGRLFWHIELIELESGVTYVRDYLALAEHQPEGMTGGEAAKDLLNLVTT